METLLEWGLSVIRGHENMGAGQEVTEDVLREGMNQSDCKAHRILLTPRSGGTTVEEAHSYGETHTYWERILSIRLDSEGL